MQAHKRQKVELLSPRFYQAWLGVWAKLSANDMRAVLCIRWPFGMPPGLVLAATGLTEQKVLVLVHKLRRTNLVCHRCYGEPIEWRWSDKSQCRLCEALLCMHCSTECDGRHHCTGRQNRRESLCLPCKRRRCAVADCQTCQCNALQSCRNCAAHVCPKHVVACAKCQSSCCSDCFTVYVDPLLGTKHTLCLTCFGANATLIQRCADLHNKIDN